jgi:hypothetical protein
MMTFTGPLNASDTASNRGEQRFFCTAFSRGCGGTTWTRFIVALAVSMDFALAICISAKLPAACLIAAPTAAVGSAFATSTHAQLIAIWFVAAPTTTVGSAFAICTGARLFAACLIAAPAAAVGIAFAICALA